jgi:hypothetical protein
MIGIRSKLRSPPQVHTASMPFLHTSCRHMNRLPLLIAVESTLWIMEMQQSELVG